MTAQKRPSRAALVFGGSRGIGAAIVQRLARDGVAVAFTYAASPDHAQRMVTSIEAAGGHCFAIKADSSEPQEIQGAVKAAVAQFTRLDIVVVSAGILTLGTVDEMSLKDFDRIVAINVRGVFAAINAAAPHLLNGGRIITIGSNTALRTGAPGGAVYSMTKAAVATLVRGAAIDLAPRGITINNVQPGPTATDMTADYADRVIPLIPLGRLGEPAEIADAVAYLASDGASFVTGASLTIDGGHVA